ncbi:MAG: sugar phosphate nucleotidyltransferase [Eubacteriales bacterium]|nr:sugar phosphate nucleotidyltransferase [Eubacteriales bacterium]
MKGPILVVLAAGMGSRYGGLKQMDPVDAQGHAILDFSVYDAMKAGFKKVVFIIKHAIEDDFKEIVGKRIEPFMEVEYVFQELDKIPAPYVVPEGRVKPFGTGHAVLCAKDAIDAPFAVINADDFYGREAFEKLNEYLTTHEDDELYRYTMVGFHVEKTITENGHVSRGVCVVDENHFLQDITERTHIAKVGENAAFTLDEGASWTEIPDGTPVSMNCWGFTPGFMKEVEKAFPKFLEENLASNPMKCEYFLPSIVADLLAEGKATVEVTETAEKWYGVTYQEDKAMVMDAIKQMKAEGKYPEELWA